MKRYLPTNWVDGMKINKHHFINEFNVHTQQQAIANEAFLNNQNFGLLPSLDNAEKNNLLYISLDNQQMVELRLVSCNAITRNGYRIAVGEPSLDAGIHLQHEVATFKMGMESVLDIGAEELYVLLNIDPFNRIPSGEIITNEVPPRHPHTSPTFSLSILGREQIASQGLVNTLPIGKLIVRNNNIVLDDNYIPPCQAVMSHEALIKTLEQWKLFLSNMEVLCLTIIQKVMQKKQENELSVPVVRVAEAIIQYVSTVVDSLNMEGLYYTPAKMISVIAGLARTINNSFSLFLGTGEEEVFVYFAEKCGIERAGYRKAASDTCHIHYNHIDCETAIKTSQYFVEQTKQLFESLAALDYIGKRKEAGIFVKEEALTLKRPGRIGTFLAD